MRLSCSAIISEISTTLGAFSLLADTSLRVRTHDGQAEMIVLAPVLESISNRLSARAEEIGWLVALR